MEAKLSKKAIGDIALASKYVRTVGGTYVVHNGSETQYQDKRKGIIIETTLNSLNTEENTNFKCTKTAEKELNEELKFLTKGKSLNKKKNIGISFIHKSDGSYLFSNGHRDVIVDHELVTLRMPTIQQFINSAERIGVDVSINNPGELSLSGKEDSTILVIRDQTFTGILTKSGEHFFKKKGRDDFLEHEPTELESEHFLEIGRENFKVGIYRNDKKWWLQTEVIAGQGIQVRILEKLKVL